FDNTARLPEAVSTNRRIYMLAVIQAQRSILARSSPPKRLFKGLVSLGRTVSVMIVVDSEGFLACIFKFLTKIKGIEDSFRFPGCKIYQRKPGTCLFNTELIGKFYIGWYRPHERLVI